MRPAIELIGLTRSFGDLVAVDHLDLEVAAGSFYGFLGPNGAGKSTTIKMLTGLLHPSSGRAALLGHDVVADAVAARRVIGVVPEELALFDRLTGPEYLTFVGRMYGVERAVIAGRRGELLELMGLAGESDKLVVDYSHGMKKKLALAAALLHEPRILFLDEPFEGIDAIASRLIRDLLGRLRQRGVTIFLTSHILEIVERLCDEIGIIHGGELVAAGPIAEMRSGASLEEVFLEVVGADDVAAATLSWLE